MITYASPQPAVQVREKIVDRPVYVDKVVEKVVEKIVEKPVYIDKIVEKVVKVKEEVPVTQIVQVEKEIPVTKYIEVEVEKLVEKFVTVPVEKLVTVEKFVEVKVEKLVPTERLVERQPIRCAQCSTILESHKEQCNTCPLVDKLSKPQAPVIMSQVCRASPQGSLEWVAAESPNAKVSVVHSLKDGWQHDCNVILYVSVDGSEPTSSRYAYKGPSPLTFNIGKTLTVRAVALEQQSGRSSVVVAQHFVRLGACGVGMLLKKINGFRGIYIQDLMVGGSAWLDGNVQPGDEIIMIDGRSVEHLDLKDIQKLISGQAGTHIRLTILREERDEHGKSTNDIASEFNLDLLRASAQEGAGAKRKAPLPLKQLDGFKLVRLDNNTSERATWTSGKIQVATGSSGSFKANQGPPSSAEGVTGWFRDGAIMPLFGHSGE